jgi:hypothetical protein
VSFLLADASLELSSFIRKYDKFAERVKSFEPLLRRVSQIVMGVIHFNGAFCKLARTRFISHRQSEIKMLSVAAAISRAMYRLNSKADKVRFCRNESPRRT